MYDIAKSARAALKSKARRLAEEKEEKVTSADWSPSEPLNADVKTGARPLKRRTYKTGGKVSGDCGPMRADRKPRKSGGRALTANSLVNRDVREANEEREGVKHVGAFKKGGRVKKMIGGLSVDGKRVPPQYEKPVPLPPRRPEPAAEQRPMTPEQEAAAQAAMDKMIERSREAPPTRKSGGRTKKMMGGPMMGGQMPGGTMMGGPGAMPVEDERQTMVRPTRMQFTGAQGTPYKKGGKVSHAEWEHSKKDLAEDKKLAKKHGMSLEQWEKSAADKKHDKQQSMKGLDKPKKAGGGMLEASKRAMMVAKDPHNQAKIKPQQPQPQPKPEDERVARKSGGRTKGKSRTNIAIVINAGKKEKDQDQGMPMPGGAMPLPGGPRAAAAPGAGMLPPMAAGAPGAPPPAPGGGGMPPDMMGALMGGGGPKMRKAGGRVYKSALDMDAGAGSGVGRLEKTEIASRQPKPGLKRGVIVDDNKGYPNKVNGAVGGRTARASGGSAIDQQYAKHLSDKGGDFDRMQHLGKTAEGTGTLSAMKKGGRTAKKAGGKVYRSYKDMDAGAGSGMGRLEKTEIESRKSVR